MQTHIGVSSSIALVVAALVAACGPSDAAKRRADSAVAAAAKAHVVNQAGEVLGARREAQPMFDGARENFVAKHRAAAAKSLREAAAFTRQQADSAAGLDKDALVASAKELNRVAAGISAGNITSVKTLDRAIARAQLSEAQFHYTRMFAAWNQNDAGVAGAELLMSVDHFDRGVADAHVDLETSTQAILTDARTLAAKLTGGAVVNASDVEKTIVAFDNELQRVATIVSKKR